MSSVANSWKHLLHGQSLSRAHLLAVTRHPWLTRWPRNVPEIFPPKKKIAAEERKCLGASSRTRVVGALEEDDQHCQMGNSNGSGFMQLSREPPIQRRHGPGQEDDGLQEQAHQGQHDATVEGGGCGPAEGIQGGTPCKHVDEHHAVCIRAIQDLARRHFDSQKQGPRKHCDFLALDSHRSVSKFFDRLTDEWCVRDCKHRRSSGSVPLLRWSWSAMPNERASQLQLQGARSGFQLGTCASSLWLPVSKLSVALLRQKDIHCKKFGSCG